MRITRESKQIQNNEKKFESELSLVSIRGEYYKEERSDLLAGHLCGQAAEGLEGQLNFRVLSAQCR